MIASDLDGTLLGDARALDRFADWLKPRRKGIALVYVTGRFFESVKNAVDEGQLPNPDALIAAVGTAIYDFPNPQPLPEWSRRCPPNWDPDRIRKILHDRPELEPQPDKFQSPLKVSYFFPGASTRDLRTLEQLLKAHGLDFHMIYSSEQHLDFLPPGMNKGAAVDFLAKRWNIPTQNVIVCGDTGNDADLFNYGFSGVVVANAQPELRIIDGPNVYHASLPFAAGALEGVKFYWREHEPD